MKLVDQPLWLRKAEAIFVSAGVGAGDAAALALAAELDDAGLTRTWEDAPADAARRQIAEWDSWAL